MNTLTLIVLLVAIALLTLGSLVFRRRYVTGEQTGEPNPQAKLLSLACTSGAAMVVMVTLFFATGVF